MHAQSESVALILTRQACMIPIERCVALDRPSAGLHPQQIINPASMKHVISHNLHAGVSVPRATH